MNFSDPYFRSLEYLQTLIGEAVYDACALTVEDLRKILLGELEGRKYLKELLLIVKVAWESPGGQMKDYVLNSDRDTLNQTEFELLAIGAARVFSVYLSRDKGKELFGTDNRVE